MILHRKKKYLIDNSIRNVDYDSVDEKRGNIFYWKQCQRSRFIIVSLVCTLFCRNVIHHSYIYDGCSNDQISIDAIVTIGMCGFQATEMVTALRKIGSWSKPIYILTDSPNNYQEYCDNGTICRIIDVQGNHPKFDSEDDFKEYVQGIHTFPVDIYSKWHKTQIFELIPQDDNISTVLFMDADLLAQRSLVDNWLPNIEHMLNNNPCPNEMVDDCELILYPERWYTTLPIIGDNNLSLTGKFNSGMMILNRESSRNILKRWGDLLVRQPFVSRDQGKLTQAIDEMDTRVCFLPNRWAHIQNEADLIDRLWFRLVGKGTFLHIASAKKKKKKYVEWNKRLQEECHYSNLTFSKEM